MKVGTTYLFCFHSKHQLKFLNDLRVITIIRSFYRLMTLQHGTYILL